MTDISPTALTETLHTLSEEDGALEQTLLAGRAPMVATTLDGQRASYDALTAQTPMADGVRSEIVEERDVRGWWVRPTGAPPDRAILFIHGGAYLLGSAAAYRGFASQVAARTGVATFVLDYPLAPEHPFPAAYEATVAALRWLGGEGIKQVALVGDAAGGGLALAALGGPEATAVASVVVFSPWVDLALSLPSMNSPETYDPVFQRAILARAATTYLGGADPTDGRASPLYSVPEQLPPLAIQVGADELLLDDSRYYAREATARGGVVQLDVYEGLHHVFQRATRELPSARRALDAASAFVTQHWIEENSSK